MAKLWLSMPALQLNHPDNQTKYRELRNYTKFRSIVKDLNESNELLYSNKNVIRSCYRLSGYGKGFIQVRNLVDPNVSATNHVSQIKGNMPYLGKYFRSFCRHISDRTYYTILIHGPLTTSM